MLKLMAYKINLVTLKVEWTKKYKENHKSAPSDFNEL